MPSKNSHQSHTKKERLAHLTAQNPETNQRIQIKLHNHADQTTSNTIQNHPKNKKKKKKDWTFSSQDRQRAASSAAQKKMAAAPSQTSQRVRISLPQHLIPPNLPHPYTSLQTNAKSRPNHHHHHNLRTVAKQPKWQRLVHKQMQTTKVESLSPVALEKRRRRRREVWGEGEKCGGIPATRWDTCIVFATPDMQLWGIPTMSTLFGAIFYLAIALYLLPTTNC